MRQVFSDFLAEYGFLPIPPFGTISTNKESARYQVGEDIMFPPMHSYQFSRDILNDVPLQDYIVKRYRINEAAAKLKLADFFDEITTSINSHRSVSLNQVDLVKEGEDELICVPVSQTFLYPINASRVIRQDRVHDVLVGDINSNTGAMSDFFSSPKSDGKNSLWMYIFFSALIIAVAVAAYYYFFSAY